MVNSPIEGEWKAAVGQCSWNEDTDSFIQSGIYEVVYIHQVPSVSKIDTVPVPQGAQSLEAGATILASKATERCVLRKESSSVAG